MHIVVFLEQLGALLVQQHPNPDPRPAVVFNLNCPIRSSHPNLAVFPPTIIINYNYLFISNINVTCIVVPRSLSAVCC